MYSSLLTPRVPLYKHRGVFSQGARGPAGPSETSVSLKKTHSSCPSTLAAHSALDLSRLERVGRQDQVLKGSMVQGASPFAFLPFPVVFVFL